MWPWDFEIFLALCHKVEGADVKKRGRGLHRNTSKVVGMTYLGDSTLESQQQRRIECLLKGSTSQRMPCMDIKLERKAGWWPRGRSELAP